MRQLALPPAYLRLGRLARPRAIPPTWDSRAYAVIDFKARFVAWAKDNQGRRCAFCCFPIGHVDYRRAYAVDHIAPKGATLYPQWTFEPHNLILLCWTCNSHFKAAADTINTASSVYKNCTFTVVHPYLDVIESHITGTYQGDGVPVGVPEFCSPKGEATMKMFKLNDLQYIVSANQEALRVVINEVQASMGAADLTWLIAAIKESAGR
jgi:uncharacterized protein (TIGR02646 family)